MRVLVVNAGSSSLKLRLLDGDDTVVAAEDLGPGPPDTQALKRWTGSLGEIGAVGIASCTAARSSLSRW